MQLFITGIDTDAGKTYATAWLARQLSERGRRVITQKFIQTGCKGSSEDIEAHRRLTGTGPLPEDAEGLTAPIILSYPASAQLAARIDGVEIDLGDIDRAREALGFIEQSRPLASECASCQWRPLCRGGCRRDREPMIDGQLSLNYFCPAYKGFFAYAYPRLAHIARAVAPR